MSTIPTGPAGGNNPSGGTGPTGETEPEPGSTAVPDATPQDLAAANSEAAKYRRRLRDAEAERDQWKERWDARNRADVEELAADRFADPTDIWSVTSLEELRGEDGLVDPEQAAAEFARVLAEKPHWKKPPPVTYPDIHQGARSTVEPPPSFGQSFKKALRGG